MFICIVVWLFCAQYGIGGTSISKGECSAHGDSLKYFKIINRSTQKCLEIDSGNKGTGVQLQQWSLNRNDWTLWYWENDYIINKYTKKALIPESNPAKNGNKIIQSNEKGDYAEWKRVGQHIIHKKSGLYLEIPSSKTDNGVKAGLWDHHGGRHERWEIHYVDY